MQLQLQPWTGRCCAIHGIHLEHSPRHAASTVRTSCAFARWFWPLRHCRRRSRLAALGLGQHWSCAAACFGAMAASATPSLPQRRMRFGAEPSVSGADAHGSMLAWPSKQQRERHVLLPASSPTTRARSPCPIRERARVYAEVEAARITAGEHMDDEDAAVGLGLVRPIASLQGLPAPGAAE